MEKILDDKLPLALRLRSHLLCGLVRIYQRKMAYLYEDADRAKKETTAQARLKAATSTSTSASAAASYITGESNVDLPAEDLTASHNAITALLDQHVFDQSILDPVNLLGSLTNLQTQALELSYAGALGESPFAIARSLDQVPMAGREDLDELTSGFWGAELARGDAAAAAAEEFEGEHKWHEDEGMIADGGAYEMEDAAHVSQTSFLAVEKARGEAGPASIISRFSSAPDDQQELGIANISALDTTTSAAAADLADETAMNISALNMSTIAEAQRKIAEGTAVIATAPTQPAAPSAASIAAAAAAAAARKRKQAEISMEEPDEASEINNIEMAKQLKDASALVLKRRPMVALPSKRSRTAAILRLAESDAATVIQHSAVVVDSTFFNAMMAPALQALHALLPTPEYKLDESTSTATSLSKAAAFGAEAATPAPAGGRLSVSFAGDRFELDASNIFPADGVEQASFVIEQQPQDMDMHEYGGMEGYELPVDERPPSPLPVDGVAAPSSLSAAAKAVSPPSPASPRGEEDALLALGPDREEGKGVPDAGAEAEGQIVVNKVPAWMKTKTATSFRELLKKSVKDFDVDRRTAASAFCTLLHLLAGEKMVASQSAPYSDIKVKLA